VSTHAAVKLMNLLSQQWLMGWTTCYEYSQLQYAADNPLRNHTSNLHVPRSKLIWIQLKFKLHPEVGNINLFIIQIEELHIQILNYMV